MVKKSAKSTDKKPFLDQLQGMFSSKRLKTWCWRTGVLCIEASAVVFMLLAVAAVILTWRLVSGPMDIGFAKDYIVEALRNPERGTYATMEQVVLHWPDLGGPLLLGLRDVEVFQEERMIVAVDEAALSLSKAHLLIGKISPIALILKRPSVHVIRTEDGGVDIGFSGAEEQDVVEQAGDQTALTTRILEYIARPGQTDDPSSPLGTLQAFKVEEARVTVEDRIMGMFWNIARLDVAFQSAARGLETKLYMELPESSVEGSYAEARVLFGWDSKDVGIEAKLVNFDLQMLTDKIPELWELRDQRAVFDANIRTQLNEDLVPQMAEVEIESGSGHVLIPDLSSDPLAFQDLGVRASYNAEQNKLSISSAQVTAKDVTVKAETSLEISEEAITGPLKVTIDELAHEKIAPLWPESLEGDNSKEWIVNRLSSGTFHDVYATMNLVLQEGEEGWDFDAQQIIAGFSFEGMDVDYRTPMIPVSNGKGSGVYDDNQEKLNIKIESAQIADLSVESAELEFIDIVKKGAGVANVNVRLSGPVKTTLDYVSREPIALKHDFDLREVKGNAKLDVNVNFPTRKNIAVEDVKVQATGTMNNVTLPSVVKELDLTEGPFSVAVKGNQFSIKGNGKLSGRPVKIEYQEFLKSKGQAYKSKVVASLTVDSKLRDHFGIDLSEFLEGSVPVNVTYTEFGEGRSEADVIANLEAVRVFVDPFDYEKPVGTKGIAKLKTKLQNGIAKEVVNLTASAPGLTLGSTNLVFRQQGQETELSHGHATQLTIGETKGAFEFEIAPSGRMKMALDGSFLDLRPFLDDEGKKTYDDPPMVISASADVIRTDDDETIKQGKIYADIDEQGRFNQLEMDALAGSGAIYMRYKPDETGKRVFRFEADDAGATLKAFGVYDKIQGGKMVAYGEPIRGVYDRNLVGSAEITDFKVVDAPGLARLLGAMSLPGLIETLGGEGITFTKLEANFDWLYRPGGGLLVLKDGRTSGNSLGLTFDGTFNKAEGTVDVSGTLVPLSEMNKFLASIPLIGDILSGGSDSIFAATYTVEGKAEEPDISVNPLSVLTPGILRQILFE